MAAEVLDPQVARQILQALRDGNVPPVGASRLCVGRETLIEGYRSLLDAATEGQAAVRFIRGGYGYGKSMLLRVFEEEALSRRFAVAKVNVRSELPFNKMEEFYRKVTREISVDQRGQGVGRLLERWYQWVQGQASKRGEESDPLGLHDIMRNEGSKSLREVRAISAGFARGVEAYLEGVLTSNRGKVDAAVTWLRGDEHQRAEDKKLLGVKGGLERETALEFLEALLCFVRWVPLAGTVVLVDEAEFIRVLPQERLRTVAYDNIRALWDACNGGEIKYTLFIFAATPETFSDGRRGFACYEALYDRMFPDGELGGENFDLRWPVVDLPLLSAGEVEELGRRLTSLHGAAESWDAAGRVKEDVLEKISEEAARGGLEGPGARPRDVVRSMIRWLDRVQAKPDASSRTLVEMFSSEFAEVAQEKEEPEELLWGEV